MPDAASSIVLRDYQQDLLDAAVRASATLDRVCLYGPTGSGKTEVGMRLVQTLRETGQRVTWCVNRIELVNQTSDRFLAHGIDHGVVQARHERTDTTKPVQIASIQTINKRPLLPDRDVIVIDEAHGAISASYQKFLATNPVKVFGLTATPFSRGLGKVFQTLIHVVSVADLTEKGWLVPARCFAPDRPDLSAVDTVAGDYHEGQLATAVDQPKLIGNIVDEWLKRAHNGRTIVFATSIDHSQHICAQFAFRGIAAEHIDCHTSDKDRIDILARLRAGVTRVVTNCAVLAEGFDLPDLECIVLARPTQSLIRYLQMAGRALRPAPGKTEALILDHSNTVESLGFPADPLPLVLDDGAPKKKKEKPPKLHICPKCSALSRRKPNPCSVCGYAPPVTAFDIDQREGTLREMTREVLPLQDRQRYYSGLIHVCLEKGYSNGWVAHQYRNRFGLWPPRDMKWYPQPPTAEVRNDLRAAYLRWARARADEKRYA